MDDSTVLYIYTALVVVLMLVYLHRIFIIKVRCSRFTTFILATFVVLAGIIVAYYKGKRLGSPERSVLAGFYILFVVCMQYVTKSPLLPAANKAVVITGCDSGFGHLLSRRLDSMGVHVFAGCLHTEGEGALKLASACSPRMRVLQLDVRDDAHVTQAVRDVTSALADDSLDLFAVVNNAGVVYYGEAEIVPLRYYEQLVSVNYLGTVRVTKAFLPLIRASRGRVVNVASLMGSTALHSLSGYCASKAAVVAFSSALRQEMQQWGVRVSAIEPGSYDTGIRAPDGYVDSLWTQASSELRQDYGKAFFDAYKNCSFPSSPHLDEVLDAMEDAILSPEPHDVYRRGYGSVLLPLVSAIWPRLYGKCQWILRQFTFYTGVKPARLCDN